MKLSYEEFCAELVKELDEHYQGKWENMEEVLKVNEKKQGIAIECSENVSAVVYPKELYRAFEEEGMDVVMEIIEMAVSNKKIIDCINIFNDWDEVKSRVKPFLINYEQNQELLERKKMVYQKKLDLAYTCYVEIEDEMLGVAGVNVTKIMLENWNITEDELYETAKNNIEYQIMSMRKAIEDLLEDQAMCSAIEEDEGLLVLSNKNKFRGAAGMLDKEFLKEFAERIQLNFYILPSSCHEVILLKDDRGVDAKELKMMVEEINRTELKTDEFLSDSIYYYDRDKNTIEIVA